MKGKSNIVVHKKDGIFLSHGTNRVLIWHK